MADDESRTSGLSTRAVHAGEPAPIDGAPVAMPIYQTSTFVSGAGAGAEVLYTRYGTNPNHEAVAAKLAALEGAEAALVLGSGMAAIAHALLAVVGSGDHIVAQRDLYGGTYTLLTKELPRLGIETSFVDPDGDWAAAIRPSTRLLFIEVPINPTMRIVDVERIVELAGAQGLPVFADTTFATPVNFRPLEHGVTLSIHSATKYLGGHSDLTAGAVAGPAQLVEQVRTRMKSFGGVLDPQAAWLLERGMKTLPVRMARHNETALALAGWLESHPAISRVFHPGLRSHPDHARAKSLLDGFGGVIGMVVRGGDDAALRVMSRFRLIHVAPSLGGVESLASMPRFTSHVGFSIEARRTMLVEDGFLRISVGLEDLQDLEAELDAALAPELTQPLPAGSG